MTVGADRRSVLTGLGALGVMGCSPQAAPDVGPREQPARPSVIVPREPLDLSVLEARAGGRLGFAAMDLSNGRNLNWRSDERFVYCSTFKMYLAAATLLRVQAGEERLDRAIPITRADMVSHAPTTEPAVGETLTIAELMKGTVELSDNPAANILIRELGGIEALRAFYRGIGDESTRVDRLEPEMNRLDGDKDTIKPARSVQNIIRLLVSAETPLNDSSKSLLTRWLIDTPTGQGRLKAGAPASWTVAHKTGTGGYGPTNDIGILYPPEGRPVVVAAYYHATAASSPADNDAVIAEATRMALSALGRA
ncbi:MAG: class A beta-lactamase [Alphaproteobacteria bacterium]|jgi:beta-lactamase class A|nr:class A beta-lactamase [Alphaproteobacteria bacterium]MBU2041722.1 class A beta-lactamase [Alphaproteobacteria bacterium]MBU2126893.1 class A beta-lactamase [Alphaproteobacteria bacterium]MBU2209593.1 class A beta-lactamase [Alphaproteobacteria bacterium]MBU2290541.1 class A beta-lactamase [Alphaproteobacteria bacterium]